MKNLMVLFCLVILANVSLACSCWPYEPNFYKNISKNTLNCIAVFDTMDYVYNESVRGQLGYFVLIDTIGSFDSAIGDTIFVVGQDGGNCGETLRQFSRGDTMVLALRDGFSRQFEKDTFYLEGACGKYFQKIENGQSADLTLFEIKTKIFNILAHTGEVCSCRHKYANFDFYSQVSEASAIGLAVFRKYDYSYSHNDLIAQTGYFILIDTIGKFNNNRGDTIYIIGEDGINCGEMLNIFSTGDTLFLALSSGYDVDFLKDTFYLKGGICGNHYLPIKNGENFGMSLTEIEEQIRSKITATTSTTISEQITLYPNPASEQLTLSSNDEIILQVRIYDASGKLIRSIQGIKNHMADIEVASFASGLYHIIIQTRHGKVMRTILKE